MPKLACAEQTNPISKPKEMHKSGDKILTSTYFSNDVLGFAPKLGRIVPFAPPSGISLFFRLCVAAREAPAAVSGLVRSVQPQPFYRF